MLLAERLDMVDFNLNMIRAMKSAPQTANYSKNAYTNGQSLGSAVKLSQNIFNFQDA